MNVSIAMCANLNVLMEPFSQGEEIYLIDPNLCTECVGHYNEPQCIEVCPVDCIVTNPDKVESREELKAKYQALVSK